MGEAVQTQGFLRRRPAFLRVEQQAGPIERKALQRDIFETDAES